MRAGRLNQTTPAASTTHFVFTRNFSYGVTGNDVKELQQFLIQENKGPSAQKLKAHGTTKTFGILTYNARRISENSRHQTGLRLLRSDHEGVCELGRGIAAAMYACGR